MTQQAKHRPQKLKLRVDLGPRAVNLCTFKRRHIIDASAFRGAPVVGSTSVALKPLKVAQFKAIPIGFREGGEACSTRGGLCVLLSKVLPFERGTVPVQCPHRARDSARLEFPQRPSVFYFKKKSASTLLSFKIKN